VLGVALPWGSQDGRISGDALFTIHAKIFDALGSPEDAFRNCVSSLCIVKNDVSVVNFTFRPEMVKEGMAVMERFLSNKSPAPEALALSRDSLNAQGDDLSELVRELAVTASFSDERSKRRPHALSAKDIDALTPNSVFVSGLGPSSLLFGSSDRESNLLQMADMFSSQTSKREIANPTPFTPGVFVHRTSGVKMLGDKLLKRPDYSHVCLSWPGPSVTSDSFFTFHVLSKLFGGGTMFSSEGLGIGYSSILYQRVLGRSLGCEDVGCHLMSSRSNGLVEISFQSSVNTIKKTSQLIKLAVDCALKATEDEIDAGRERAVMSYLKSIDGPNRFLEAGIHEVQWGEMKDPAGVVNGLRSVTRDQIFKAIENTFKGIPSVAVIGDGKPEDANGVW
jgi:hypothetical protein